MSPDSLINPRRRWVFLAFLASVHWVMWQGPLSPFGKLLFLTHIGLGLLWQPFIQPRRRLGFGGTALVVLGATLFAVNLNWMWLGLWLLILTGVVGGKVFFFPNRWERLFYLAALGYLGAALFGLVLPAALPDRIGTTGAEWLVLILLPLLLVMMAALPAESTESVAVGERTEIVDYIYGVLIFLLMLTIALGSISFALLSQVGYIESLLMTLAIVAGVLLLLGFIWNPRAGFSGLGSAIAQHVLTMGMPLEDWLDSLAVLAQRVRDAELFLTRACEELPQRLPGVTGGRWEAGAAQREFGHSSHYPVSFVFPELTVELSCRVAPGPALRWQYGLAVRLLAELYGGKCQARELQRMSQVEAVHETGARLTHDIKNLLQSLDNLCAAGVQAEGDASGRFQALLRRQLPEISNRLRHTLVKLRAPQTGMAQACSAAGWFRGFAERAAAQDIGCSQENIGLQDQLPDEDLFASVAENLLQNILDKRHRCPELQATCRLFKSSTASATATATATATASASAAGIVLEMTDDGPAIDPRVVRRLFRERLESSSGLGIGLYQSARLAEEHGYQLVLTDNRAGCVCFRLEPKLL